MSFSVKFVAFYLLPCFILVSCVPPEYVHPLPTQRAETTTAKVTGNQQPVSSHSTVSPQKIPAPPGKNESTIKTGNTPDRTGSNHPNVTNKMGSDKATSSTKTTTNHSIAAPAVDPTPKNSTGPSHEVKNGTIPMNTSASNDSAPSPHHKKTHPSAVPPHSSVTHPHVAVPVNSMPESENILEDMAHPAPRPLRAAEKFNPTFGAIVAAICITTAVGGYVILMAWRKIEMDRYGNRQMLINEDDFGDIQDEDMRHFEASCIQIDA